MRNENQRGLTLCLFENLDFPGLVHVVTTRVGGCSAAPWESLNLSFGVGDAPENG
ncbi:MAG: laccase domain-containing protein [Deltaproteobacteria bacterium]|nr:laccase domain-containing protein [Deltaproteobacteria bacterium]